MSEDLKRLHDVFLAVLDEPPQTREKRLRELSDGDDALYNKVASMLADADDESPDDIEPASERPKDPSQPSARGAPRAGPRTRTQGDVLLKPGDRVGGCMIRERIGDGGMSIVYEARQLSPDRIVALKTLRTSVATPALRRRFVVEANVLARLTHRGIAEVYAAGVQEQTPEPLPYLVMEFIRAAKPITIHSEDGKLPLNDRLALFTQICDAIHFGHERGVIHRDIKPDNILVTQGGEPKVLDFGVAFTSEPEILAAAEEGAPAEIGQIVGTPGYMAPEQCEAGGEVTTQSDVYALGAILYELVCGKPPHVANGMNLPALLMHIRSVEPTEPRAINSGVSRDLNTVITTALARKRSDRYPSVHALKADVERVIEGKQITAANGASIPRRSPLLLWIILAAAALQIATLVWAFSGSNEPPPPQDDPTPQARNPDDELLAEIKRLESDLESAQDDQLRLFTAFADELVSVPVRRASSEDFLSDGPTSEEWIEQERGLTLTDALERFLSRMDGDSYPAGLAPRLYRLLAERYNAFEEPEQRLRTLRESINRERVAQTEDSEFLARLILGILESEAEMNQPSSLQQFAGDLERLSESLLESENIESDEDFQRLTFRTLLKGAEGLSQLGGKARSLAMLDQATALADSAGIDDTKLLLELQSLRFGIQPQPPADD